MVHLQDFTLYNSYVICNGQEHTLAVDDSAEDIQKKFPSIKVNKRSCSVKLFGFQKRISADESLFAAAQLADCFYQAGRLYHEHLSQLHKPLGSKYHDPDVCNDAIYMRVFDIHI